MLFGNVFNGNIGIKERQQFFIFMLRPWTTCVIWQSLRTFKAFLFTLQRLNSHKKCTND